MNIRVTSAENREYLVEQMQGFRASADYLKNSACAGIDEQRGREIMIMSYEAVADQIERAIAEWDNDHPN